jgi:hypothetical protein
MERKKDYPRVVFDAASYRKIVDEFKSLLPGKPITFPVLSITRASETWTYDDFEEFLSAVEPISSSEVSMLVFGEVSDFILNVHVYPDRGTSVTIKSKLRERITRLANVVDAEAKRCLVPLPEPPAPPIKVKPVPKIFIGHGGSAQWRDLKDHLHEHHKYDVVFYEIGERAGHTIRDVIEDMLKSSSFAVLVMTGEDEQPDGSLRARQNVVHELGLFQGRLGFTKAVVLLEEGTEEFSNIHGVQQIKFPKGGIRQTFGDVLAVLRREFGSDSI